MGTQFIRDKLQSAIDTLMGLIQIEIATIKDVGDLLIEIFNNDKKCFVFGTGGSNLAAQRFASALLGVGERKKLLLPVFLLAQDFAAMSAFSAAQEFEDIYLKYVDAFVSEGDAVVAFTATGNNPAVLSGLERAHAQGAKTISFTGTNTSQLKIYCDYVISTPARELLRINEAHFVITDIVVEYIERAHFQAGD